jgi:hypothetical protein
LYPSDWYYDMLKKGKYLGSVVEELLEAGYDDVGV